jgi:hypothetical protein
VCGINLHGCRHLLVAPIWNRLGLKPCTTYLEHKAEIFCAQWRPDKRQDGVEVTNAIATTAILSAVLTFPQHRQHLHARRGLHLDNSLYSAGVVAEQLQTLN